MDRQRVRIRSAIASAIVFGAPFAAAEPAAPQVEVAFSASTDTPGCFSEPEFRDAVRQRVAFVPYSGTGGAPPIRAQTRIDRDGARLRATIALTEPDGTREATQEIRARLDECSTLSAAAALAVSMAIERELVRLEERSAAEAPSTPAPRVEARAPAPPPTRPPVAAREEHERLDVRSHATLVVGLGLLPENTAGARFGASLGRERWSVGLEAGAWLPTEAPSPLGGGASARLVFLGGTACVWHRSLFLCGAGTLGDLRAAGTGALLSRSTRSTYVALGGRTGIELPLVAPFSLLLHAGVVIPLVRTTLRIAEETLWKAPAVGGEAGLSWRITIL